MDNLTHTFFGLALARTGLERTTPRATAALLIGANLPDIDLVTWLAGNITYLQHHRGMTHSITGIFWQAGLVAALLYLLHRRQVAGPARTKPMMLLLMALIGMGSHLLLDYTNSYGIRPFLPFQSRWYAGDLVFIIDPWLLAILALGLGVPSLFRLVYQEIGAKTRSYQLSATLTLLGVGAFWGCKWISHQNALDELAQRSYPTGVPVRLGALPRFLNPFAWYGVVETEKAYHLTFAGWSILQSDFETRRLRTLPKTAEGSIVDSAVQGAQARIFMDFARYPIFQVTPAPDGYEVLARDLRFDFATRFRKGFLCRILLDRNLKVVSEQFRF